MSWSFCMSTCLSRTIRVIYNAPYRSMACTFQKGSCKLFSATWIVDFIFMTPCPWTNTPWHNEARKELNKKRQKKMCSLGALDDGCMFAGFTVHCFCFGASTSVRACVCLHVHRAPASALQEHNTSVCWQWRQVEGQFTFPLFYRKYGSGLKRMHRTWKHRQEVWKCPTSSNIYKCWRAVSDNSAPIRF